MTYELIAWSCDPDLWQPLAAIEDGSWNAYLTNEQEVDRTQSLHNLVTRWFVQ